MTSDDDHIDEIDFVSKSDRKRQSHALQALGERLVGLSESQLQKLSLDEEALLAAVRQVKTITHHSGRRRQLQYIGKLMRSIDATKVSAALDNLTQESTEAKAREHLIEGARDALLARGDEALTEVLDIWPTADRQTLRNFARKAQSEKKRGTPPVHARKLFRYLRSLSDAAES